MLTQLQLTEACYDALYLHHYGAVEICDPAPNPMFSDLQHLLTKFIRPAGGAKWTCAVCGKRRGRAWFWTQLVPFWAAEMGGFTLTFGDMLPPLTPVCGDHPLTIWPDDPHSSCTQDN